MDQKSLIDFWDHGQEIRVAGESEEGYPAAGILVLEFFEGGGNQYDAADSQELDDEDLVRRSRIGSRSAPEKAPERCS